MNVLTCIASSVPTWAQYQNDDETFSYTPVHFWALCEMPDGDEAYVGMGLADGIMDVLENAANFVTYVEEIPAT